MLDALNRSNYSSVEIKHCFIPLDLKSRKLIFVGNQTESKCEMEKCMPYVSDFEFSSVRYTFARHDISRFCSVAFCDDKTTLSRQISCIFCPLFVTYVVCRHFSRFSGVAIMGRFFQTPEKAKPFHGRSI